MRNIGPIAAANFWVYHHLSSSDLLYIHYFDCGFLNADMQFKFTVLTYDRKIDRDDGKKLMRQLL